MNNQFSFILSNDFRVMKGNFKNYFFQGVIEHGIKVLSQLMVLIYHEKWYNFGQIFKNNQLLLELFSFSCDFQLFIKDKLIKVKNISPRYAKWYTFCLFSIPIHQSCHYFFQIHNLWCQYEPFVYNFLFYFGLDHIFKDIGWADWR